jgi:hypothetical protein
VILEDDMAIKCSSCGNAMADGSQFCGVCGRKMEKKKKILPIIAILILLLIGAVFLAFEMSDMFADKVNNKPLGTNNETSSNVDMTKSIGEVS